MKIKVFYPNEKGNIELTKEKLEAILTEAYNEGYRDGKNYNGYYCGGITTTPYINCGSDTTYLSTTASSALSTEKLYGKITSTEVGFCDRDVSTIDNYINTCDKTTADILEGKAKNAIIVEYAEAANEV